MSLGPGDAGPACVEQLSLPITEVPEASLHTLFRGAPFHPIPGDIGGKPGAHFVPELLFLRRQIQIHVDSPPGKSINFAAYESGEHPSTRDAAATPLARASFPPRSACRASRESGKA